MPSMDSVPYIVASAIIHQGYQWFLLSAYKVGDYTKVYPVARGTGPVVVTIVAIIVLRTVKGGNSDPPLKNVSEGNSYIKLFIEINWIYSL